MASTIYQSKDTNSHRSHIPRLNIDAAMASQPSSAPPSPKPNNSNGSTPPKPKDHGKDTYRLLSHDEWVQFCRGVGVFKDDESEEVIRPTSTLWPPKGFRDGLYQDVLTEKTLFTYKFHSVDIISWLLMLLQIAMGAVLTALGSVSSSKNGTAITSIAAVNTCVGGILALLHNSGLPARYRSDRNEFYKLEEHIKSIVDTALVPVDQDINAVLANCYEIFRDARQTVQNNIPASYTTSPTSGKAPGASVSKAIEPKK
ncbi:putative c6 transcription factor protein [Daldinia childiae]|uniref:putative c6 transcription factor protein n=1 Tax=Daldinia childiae TaxID=326645 RepID=UPI0014452DC0|nr:putative c6 transcription factor protein [Daldinia childiae]KAF3067105.1 putative c6 transcription factor protein [Daldinia childiae]